MEPAMVEVRLTNPGTPTRRVAVGASRLDGEGGTRLLEALGAQLAASLDPDDRTSLHRVLARAEDGHAPPRSWLRHRCQRDTVGLRRATHRLTTTGSGTHVVVHPSVHTSPAAHAVALVATAWDHRDRERLLQALRRGLTGQADRPDQSEVWAAATLGVGLHAGPREVQRAFRRLLLDAHPDTGRGGGPTVDELLLARRALLGAGQDRPTAGV